MLFATLGVESSFNNVMYSQIDDVAMGSSLGLALVNIFVDFYEDQLFENIHRSTLYYRYIDDMFALSGDEQEVVEFFN